MAGTRITYGSDVLEAIWALACQLSDGGQIRQAEIRRRLASDQSPLGRPLDIPKRSLADIIKRLKTQRGEPEASVSPGESVQVMDALDLAILGANRLEVNRIRRKQARGDALTPSDIDVMRKAALTNTELRRKAAKPNSSKPGANGNGRSNATSPSSLTSQLSKALRDAKHIDREA